MMSESASQLAALVEVIAPRLDEERAARAIRFMLALASEHSGPASTLELEQARVDRELGAGR